MRLFSLLCLSISTSTLFGLQISDIEKLDLNVSNMDSLLVEFSRELIDIKRREFELLKRLERLNKDSLEHTKKIDDINKIISSIGTKEIEPVVTEPKRASISQEEEIIKEIKPTTFELKQDCSLFDSPNGVSSSSWQKGKRFTSISATKNFIKASGEIFIGGWRSLKGKAIWIEKDCVDRF